MRAVLIDSKDSDARFVEDADESLLTGPVELDVLFSSYNYKDAMAIAGKGIARSFPLIPGIDMVGRVTASEAEQYSAGDLVILNGDGIGESLHGGFATRARVRPDALVRLPAEISPDRAAAIGTAGFTAMLSVLRLEDTGIEPGSGDVLVTGASGGVGSIAVALLAARGTAWWHPPGGTKRTASTCVISARPTSSTAQSSPRSPASRCSRSGGQERSTAWAAPRSPTSSHRPPGEARSRPTGSPRARTSPPPCCRSSCAA
ncbi:MAG: alcohol dehydrogenase catalytic domain-containing protein [Brachybacterium tyrofermentans]